MFYPAGLVDCCQRALHFLSASSQTTFSRFRRIPPRHHIRHARTSPRKLSRDHKLRRYSVLLSSKLGPVRPIASLLDCHRHFACCSYEYIGGTANNATPLGRCSYPLQVSVLDFTTNEFSTLRPQSSCLAVRVPQIRTVVRLGLVMSIK